MEMKTRIGATGGIVRVSDSLFPGDAALGKDTSAVGDNSELSSEETLALTALLVTSLQHELAAPDQSTGSQRVEAKAAVTFVAWPMPAALTVAFQATAQVSMHASRTSEAEQGAASDAPNNLSSDVRSSTRQRAAATAQDAAMLRFVAPASASLPPSIELRPLEAAPPTAKRDGVGDGHAGHGNSSSDEEQAKRSLQFASVDTAAGAADRLVPGLYQPPLFNRRLETNGVDDALLLAREAARREAMMRKPEVTSAVQPVQPATRIVEITTVVAEIGRADVALEFDAPAVARRRQEEWNAEWRDAAACCVIILATAMAAAAGSARSPATRYRRQAGSPVNYVDLSSSDPRSIGVVERAKCWVAADVPGDTVCGSRRPVRSLNMNPPRVATI